MMKDTWQRNEINEIPQAESELSRNMIPGMIWLVGFEVNVCSPDGFGNLRFMLTDRNFTLNLFSLGHKLLIVVGVSQVLPSMSSEAGGGGTVNSMA